MLEETKDRERIESHIGVQHQLPSDSKVHRSRAFRVTMWVVILAVFAVIFFAVTTHRAAPQRNTGGRRGAASLNGPPVTLNTVPVRNGNLGVYLQAIGTVTPLHTVSVTPQATGPIAAIDFREGQMVRQGEQLLQIDPRPYQAALAAAEGVLARDTGLLAQAQMDLARYQNAWAHNAIQKQIMDDEEKLVVEDQGTVKSDQGTVELDRVNLSYCIITAPIAGRVGLRLVDPGNIVQANSSTPLVVVAQLQPITVVFTIAEDNVPEVQQEMRAGKPLPVDVYDRSELNKLGTGTLTSLDNQIDTTTGTLKLRATFSNKDGALFPNMFVNTKLLVKTLKNVTLVENSTIQHNGDVAFVYVIRNGVAHLEDVKTGATDNGITQILEGASPGDQLANTGFEKLLNGSRVTVSNNLIVPSAGSLGNEP